jgi:hypothetical protein
MPRPGDIHRPAGASVNSYCSWYVGFTICLSRDTSQALVPVACRTRKQGHGRAERRTLKVTAVAAGLAFPQAAHAIQIVRRRRPLTRTKWSAETVYAITSLTAIQARPAELAAIARGHWLIHDQMHWVRDLDRDEDRSQVRTGNAPPRHGQPAQPEPSPSCG